MRQHKNIVQEVVRDKECGLMFESFEDLQEEDEVFCYRLKEVTVPLNWDLQFWIIHSIWGWCFVIIIYFLLIYMYSIEKLVTFQVTSAE